jgi:hypothetical protein
MKCPECGAKNAKKIVYGLPSAEMDEDNVIMGGCLVSFDNKNYHCVECEHEFNSKAQEVKRRRELFKKLRSESGDNLYFDEYNYDDVVSFLEAKYAAVGLKIKSVGGFVPVQAEGNVDGKFFYFRFRHDNARLMVGDDAGERSLPVNASTHEILGLTGDGFSGVLDPEEFRDVFIKLLDMYISSKSTL